MILYILLGLLVIVIIQLGMAISTLSTIQMLSRDFLLSRSRASENQIKELEKIQEELKKQTLQLDSIDRGIDEIRDPQKYKTDDPF